MVRSEKSGSSGQTLRRWMGVAFLGLFAAVLTLGFVEFVTADQSISPKPILIGDRPVSFADDLRDLRRGSRSAPHTNGGGLDTVVGNPERITVPNPVSLRGTVKHTETPHPVEPEHDASQEPSGATDTTVISPRATAPMDPVAHDAPSTSVPAGSGPGHSDEEPGNHGGTRTH